MAEKKTLKQFIKDANKVHLNKYDYSKVEYKNAHIKVCIICPDHGEFWQIPNNHLNGNGCPKCRTVKMKKLLTFDKKQFVERSNVVHNNKYDYSDVYYVNARSAVDIICPSHGTFQQTPDNHLKGHGCPKCANVKSQPEKDIIDTLKPLVCEQGNRKVLNGKEIDIFIPSLNLGIEYNGLLWHSEAYGKDKHYHLNKQKECERRGVNLIQIFEDEWINKRNVCEYKLKEICDINKTPQITEDICEIKTISEKLEVRNFIEENSLGNCGKFSIAIGAYYKQKLVGVMAFSKYKNNCYTLNAAVFDIHYQYSGIFGKLMNFFLTNNIVKRINTFLDRRWLGNISDNLYTRFGFKFNKFIGPLCSYYSQAIEQFSRFTKKEFQQLKEKRKNNSKYDTKIWDCGKVEYIFWVL